MKPKIVTDFNYKEKCFLEFQITRLRFLVQKGEFRSLVSFPRIRELTYSQFFNRCGTDASPLMGSNTKSLSLIHLAMARASPLAFAIQGDP